MFLPFLIVMLTTGAAGQQTACAAGKYQASEQSSCTDADAGYYVVDSRNENSKKIAAGYYHTCALLDDGSVSCWGRNNYGQLGDGTTTQRTAPTQTSSLGTAAVAIAAGIEHTCAILDDGTVSCWGRNYDSQLGIASCEDLYDPYQYQAVCTATTSLGTDRTAVAIGPGNGHTCALLDDGSVSCWGRNYDGELGDGTNTNTRTPTQTSSLGGTAVAIAVGFHHTCALLNDGTVRCWGWNYNGQLGDGTTGTTARKKSPTQTLSLGRTAVAIAAGIEHTCALLDDGSVSCWGRNNYGQLGDGTTTQRTAPTQTSSLGGTAVVITAAVYHTCALLDDGSVSCWGRNNYGQLGDNTTTDRYTPTATSSLDRTAVAIAAGIEHTCAILDDGTVSCWGRNYNGQLGDGTTGNARYTPTATSSLGTDRTAVIISAESQTACAAGTYQVNTGQSSCTDASAGYYVNSTAQISQTACAAGTYQAITGQSSCTDASAGYYVNSTAQTACAAGTYQANTGQSSCTDAEAGYYRPRHYVVDSRNENSKKIALGNFHTCAILDDGTVSCWGWNYNGQLGDGTTGTTARKKSPTQTLSLGTDRTAVAITAGAYHTCALLDDGSVSCWGRNYDGQLGDGTTTLTEIRLLKH